MGGYMNPGNEKFGEALKSQIYVDKTGLIEYTNRVMYSNQKYVCVSRPRRFGKSMAANMLTAYYSRGCDSRELFQGLKISKTDAYEKKLNQYNTIFLNMQEFLSQTSSMEEMLRLVKKSVLWDLFFEYPDINYFDKENFSRAMQDVYQQTKCPFVIIIDEWDCIFREYRENHEAQEQYLDFLRDFLKDKAYIHLAYMTGILPIKKYGTHSALNMFDEYSMTNQMALAEFTGFTEQEVKALCEKYGMSFEETKRWYDGYDLKGLSVYNPRSVVMAMTSHDFDNYWTKTETYESLKKYIQINSFGLKEIVKRLIAGEHMPLNPDKFQNDMTTFNSADDVLTLLVHLGYLTFDFDTKTVWIPNSEVQREFINSIEDGGWEEVMKAIRISDELLTATLNCNEEKVAIIIEQVHRENTSILQYNNENSLSCVLSLAYYSAKKDYAMYRELPGGNGFADLVFIPRNVCQNLAFIVELKWDKSAETAIDQIKQKKYADCLKDYSGEILLVGINYDKADKRHTCKIEKITK